MKENLAKMFVDFKISYSLMIKIIFFLVQLCMLDSIDMVSTRYRRLLIWTRQLYRVI